MTTAFKIYAVKDRLLDYFQQPFIATNDNQVKAALADLVNNLESGHAISQAPQHFELYRLGEVTEGGHVISTFEFLADCASLVRTGIRNRATPGDGEVPQPLARGAAPTADRIERLATDGSGHSKN